MIFNIWKHCYFFMFYITYRIKWLENNVLSSVQDVNDKQIPFITKCLQAKYVFCCVLPF